MSRPTVMNGWWLELLVERGDGEIQRLASTLGVTPRTLNRWFKGELEPRGGSVETLRRVAGEELLQRDGCPAVLANQREQAGPNGDGEPCDGLADESDDSPFLEPQDPDEDVEFTPQRKLYTNQGDPEIDSLHRRHKRGILDIQPDFQRQYVWDATKASRLIESILLEIPLPVLYLSEERDDKVYVIDGQQRLTSVFSFIDGHHPSGGAFKLVGLKVHKDLTGSTFSDLRPSLQDKITTYKIRTITFLKDSDRNLKYEIFERLNSGSVSLNDQELRNCIFRGPYNDAIKRLAANPDFRYLLGFKGPHKRMNDVELVLRFAAFFHKTYLKYQSPMKMFLNQDAEAYRGANPAQVEELESAFKNACSTIRSLFGAQAFKRFYAGSETNPNGYWEPTRFNASLFDVTMGIFAMEDKHTIYRNLDAVREAIIDLMTNDRSFIDAIELSTSSNQAVRTRFDKLRNAISGIIGNQAPDPRLFSRSLKEELFARNPDCQICGNRINEIDDAAVDHVAQYWTGGRTIPENARLAHRYCNNSRSRKD